MEKVTFIVYNSVDETLITTPELENAFLAE